MSVFTILRDLDQKFSWSFFGFLLAVLLGLFTVYDRLLADKNPQLYFDVLNSTSVLDIKEDLPKLDVLFDGLNIREQSLSLHIMTVKVINDSSRDILKGHYDTDDPVGFAVSPGSIIRTDVSEASNAYLERNVSFNSATNNVVQFKNVIIEAHEFFVLKILILHPASKRPTITPIGHVAGVQEIIVREPYKDIGRVSFWALTFSGSVWSQVLRLVGYSILTILLILLVVIPTSLISDKMDELKRRRTVKVFKSTSSIDLNESDEFIFTCYILGRSHLLLTMERLAKTSEALHKAYRVHCKHKKQRHRLHHAAMRRYLFEDPWYAANLMPKFLDAGFVTVAGDTPSIDPHQRTTLEHFMRFLKSKGLAPRKDNRRIVYSEGEARELMLMTEMAEQMHAEATSETAHGAAPEESDA